MHDRRAWAISGPETGTTEGNWLMSRIEDQKVLLLSDQAIEIADLHDFLARLGVSDVQELSDARALDDALDTGAIRAQLAFVGLRSRVENERSIERLLAHDIRVVAINGGETKGQPDRLVRLPRPFTDGSLTNAVRQLGFTG